MAIDRTFSRTLQNMIEHQMSGLLRKLVERYGQDQALAWCLHGVKSQAARSEVRTAR
jgi:hypothetical protein